MSCWVVPSVAADFWHVPFQEIIDRITAGTLLTRVEGDFLFVDIAPDGDTISQHCLPRAPSPQTYTAVTAGKVSALPATATEELPEPEDITPTILPDISQWRSVRKRVAATRRPPAKQVA